MLQFCSSFLIIECCAQDASSIISIIVMGCQMNEIWHACLPNLKFVVVCSWSRFRWCISAVISACLMAYLPRTIYKVQVRKGKCWFLMIFYVKMGMKEKAFKSQKWCSWQGTSAPENHFFVNVEQITLICMDKLDNWLNAETLRLNISVLLGPSPTQRVMFCVVSRGMPFWHPRKCSKYQFEWHWVAVQRWRRVMAGHDGSW